ncbi:MAG: hypothetical protein HY559_04970 [Gammaproteobacteria bacterium]|nr:hypothetical protein [Gammaproteobacteria bacterium]
MDILDSKQEVRQKEGGQALKEEVWEYGDLLLDHLARLGVEYVFGVPGGGIEPLYNALARSERRGGPRAIVSRHETGAAFMANGYARESKRLGVCCATTGPGSTNLITGVSCAFTDAVPILVITAQTALPNFGRGSAQESSCTGLNTVAMFEPCTRFNTLVSHVDQLENKLLIAISHAFGVTPGPVHLSIPLDILRMPAPKASFSRELNPFIEHEICPNSNAQGVLGTLLENAKNITFVLGQDSESAIKDILTYAEQKGCAVVTTPMGKGLISAFHPLYRGVFGLAGHESAYQAVLPESAEFVVVVGTAFDECASGAWDTNLLSNRLIHIDEDPNNLSASHMACLCVLGSPKQVFQKLLERTQNKTTQVSSASFSGYDKKFPAYFSAETREHCLMQHSVPIKPQALFWTLSQLALPNTRVTMDIGNSFLWGIHYWMCNRRGEETRNLFHVSLGFGSMGWAIGASVGIATANRNNPVICFTGDGSMLMNGQEFTTALQENLNILFVVLNDSALGTVKHGQRLAQAEPIAYELPPVNFAAIGKAMGIRSYRIRTVSELMALNIPELLKQSGPTLLDVLIDKEESPPLGLRMKMLGTAEVEVPSKLEGRAHEEIPQNKIYSKLWGEEALPDNPFAAAACYCHGYDVYGDLLGKVSWVEYLYLLFKGELPEPPHRDILQRLAIALANPGPREPSVIAAMSASVGGSTWAATLSAALAVGAGQLGGAHEVALAIRLWKDCGQSLENWKKAILNNQGSHRLDIWSSIEHVPGFDPHGVHCSTPVKQTLDLLSTFPSVTALPWLRLSQNELEHIIGYPLALSGVAAATFFDLGFDPDEAELLYLLLRLPGAAVHAKEQREIGFRRFPFFSYAVELEHDPAKEKKVVLKKGATVS